MHRHTRYTSPVHSAARFVAQRLLLKSVVWTTTRVTVSGSERLEHLQPPFVVVANHASHLDAPLIMCGLPYRHTRFLAAGAATDYFFDVWWRKGLTALFFNAFPVDRQGLRNNSGMASRLLRDRVPLLLFPEGTRSPDGQMRRFKSGAAALCLSEQVPCLPVALVGAGAAMPRGTSWPHRGRPEIRLVIGEPIHPRDGERVAQFSQRVADAVAQLHRSAPAGGTTAAPTDR